jgi:hypothetical protein
MTDQNPPLGGPLKKPAAPAKGLGGKPLSGKPLGGAPVVPATPPASAPQPPMPMQFELDDGGGKPAAKPAAKAPDKDPTPATFNPFSDQQVSVPVGGGASAEATDPVPPSAAPGTGRTARKPTAQAPAADPGDGDIAPGMAKDLWSCPHCGARNKPARTTCRACDKSPDDEVETPWFKKPAIIGGIAGGVLLLVILLSLMGGTDLGLHPAGPGHLDGKVRMGKAEAAEIDLGDNHKFFVKKSVSVSGRIILAQQFPLDGKLTAVVLALGSRASDDSAFDGWKAEFKDEAYAVTGAPRAITLFLVGEGKTDLQRGGYLSVRGQAGVIENDARIVDGTTGSDTYVVKVVEQDRR